MISQPFFFPWIGLLEQLRLADIFVHYDDVQYSKGGFMNRVQIKTPGGTKWLTVMLDNVKLGQNINQVKVNITHNWRQSHYDFLKQNYQHAPYVEDMLEIVRKVYWQLKFDNLADLVINSVEELARYFGLEKDTAFCRSSDLGIPGKSTQRVLDIVKYFGATDYITGMGALKYFDFDLFERNHVAVNFINYKKVPYKQMHGMFTPFVSSLDLIANEGKNGLSYICSDSMYWRDFIKTESAIKYLDRA